LDAAAPLPQTLFFDMIRKFSYAPLWLGVFLAGILPLPAQNTTSIPAGVPRRPSIILIVADGLGCDDVGCYGLRDVKTPVLDQMAAEGVRFSSYYAGSPYKFPARAALLTGRDTGHLASPGDTEVFLPNDAPTVAEILKNAGYHTGCIGEWDLASEGSLNVPQRRGFDEWAGFYTDAEADAEFPPYVWRYDPPNAASSGYDGKVEMPQNENGGKGRSANDIFTTAAKNFIRINMPDQFNRHQPFFLFLGFPLPRGGHDAAVAGLDAAVGKIFAALRDLKIDSNTMVFVTSDTGSWKKNNRTVDAPEGLRDADLRVPLIAWCPAKFRAGEENYLPVAAWDILPTFAEIARAEVPDHGDGISFLQPLLGRPQLNRHDFLYWEIHPPGGRQQAARMGDWVAERPAPGQPLELFSLKADRAQRTDLAKEHPDLVSQFEDYLKTRQGKP
jgi:arylsulfatase A-like enzyme